MIVPRRLVSLTALVTCLAGAGCGTAGDDRRVGEVTDHFYRALRAHQGSGACDQLSTGAVDSLESASGRSCGQAITGLDLPGVGSAATTVYLDSARAEVAGAGEKQAVFLDRTSRGWRISAAGCRPKGDAPYDCELTG